MKWLIFKIFVIICFLTANFPVSAKVYFISPGGSDLAGDGTNSSPWRSLYRASRQAIMPGDTIFVQAGIYDEVKTSRIEAGVSLVGEGNNSIITSSALTAEWNPIIDMRSPFFVNGDQTISYIKFDGSSLKAAQALWIAKRNNIEIHHCTFVDFNYLGILWVGDGGNAGGDPYNKITYPAHYATGSKFHNNVIANCSLYSDWGRGGLYIGGHEGMLIYRNTITQTQRPAGQNGYPVKIFANGGFMKGLKIYDNVITKIDPYTWGFAIEGAFFEGCEIYNNCIIGAIDINFIDKGNYDYGAYIHDNTLGPEATSTTYYEGVILEFGVEDVIIERNHFRNCAVGIHHTMRYPEPWVKRVKVRYNIFSNLGSGTYHSAIRFGETEYNFDLQDYEIYNNVFQGNPASKPYFGLHIRGFKTATRIKILNNIFMNFGWTWFESNRGDYFNDLNVRNNILYNNGNSNSPLLHGTPSNYINSGNRITRPYLYSETDFHPKSNSPVIDAGISLNQNLYDMDSVSVGNPPNIGCYELTGISEGKKKAGF
ncbi:MAG: hypothetical protein LLG13_02860 [Bacteroidales bacterium]|nr:hypothetical protein [Bacteroidales bacterium]